MNTPLRRTARNCASVFLAVLTTACLNDHAVAPGPNDDGSPTVRLGLHATILGATAGQTVRISAYYVRADGTQVPLVNTPTAVSVTPGVPQQVAVVVRIGPCLADPQHASGTSSGCEVGINLALDEDGTIIDEQSSPPTLPLQPGTTTTVPAITFTRVAQVTLGDTSVLRQGESRTLRASAKDPQGNALTSREFRWSSDNPGVLSINAATGAVTAVAPGSVRITATTGVRTGTATVRVIRRVTGVVLGPVTPPPVVAATTLALVATAKANNGVDAGDLADRTVTRSVVNPAGATRTANISPDGTFTGVYPGDADVTVSIDGLTATLRLRVNAARVAIQASNTIAFVGDTMPLTAKVFAADNSVLPNVPLTWDTSDPTVATVDASGVVKVVGPGLATITVTGGGASDSAPIHVATAALSVEPNRIELLTGETSQLSAGNAIGPVTWETSDAAVATVSSTGLVTAHEPGTAVIRASAVSDFGTQRGTATIIVKAATQAVPPDSGDIYESEPMPFAATARDSGGGVLDASITSASGSPQLPPATRPSSRQ